MHCLKCGCPESRVIYTINDDLNKVIKRRRSCLYCEKRFTTHERVFFYNKEKINDDVLSECGQAV